jgi:hypothetical protein
VVAIPLAAIVEGDEEEIGALELFQKIRGVWATSDGVGERGGHRFEDGGLEQELLPPAIERIEHDLRQVIDDVPVRSAEARDERTGIIRIPERERCEVDARRPAFGSFMQRRERGVVQPKAGVFVQERRFLFLGEAQVDGT